MHQIHQLQQHKQISHIFRIFIRKHLDSSEWLLECDERRIKERCNIDMIK